jgi:hypothetical protein
MIHMGLDHCVLAIVERLGLLDNFSCNTHIAQNIIKT